jgi:DNA-binding NtrC family response regulator
MKTRCFLTALLVLVGLGSSGKLLACGDKVLTFTRGSRYQHAKAVRPAAILVYADPASNLPKALANLPLDATLRKAGYRPTIVSDANAFERALSQGGWDLILVDAAQSEAIRSRLQRGPGPVVLTVVYNPTKPELQQARKLHQAVLKSPTKREAFLDTVDEALAMKSRTHEGQ